jgi:hypothetical protein
MAADLVEPAVPIRTKLPRYFSHICTVCGNTDSIDRALFVTCPTCSMPPGAPCIDMRSKAKGNIVPLEKIHASRVKALAG